MGPEWDGTVHCMQVQALVQMQAQKTTTKTKKKTRGQRATIPSLARAQQPPRQVPLPSRRHRACWTRSQNHPCPRALPPPRVPPP